MAHVMQTAMGAEHPPAKPAQPSAEAMLAYVTSTFGIHASVAAAGGTHLPWTLPMAHVALFNPATPADTGRDEPFLSSIDGAVREYTAATNTEIEYCEESAILANDGAGGIACIDDIDALCAFVTRLWEAGYTVAQAQ